MDDRRTAYVRSLAAWLFVPGLAVILFATLFPFDFSFTAESILAVFRQRFQFQFSGRSVLADVPPNILLFIPVGFSCAGLFSRWLSRRWAIVLLSTAAGVFLSTWIELAQVFIPVRIPAAADILANGAGSLAGAAAFLFIIHIAARVAIPSAGLFQVLSVRKTLWAVLLTYTLIMAVLPFGVRDVTSLTGLDPGYRLSIGNEMNAERPWEGSVSSLFIAARAISLAEVERLYQGGSPEKLFGNALVGGYLLDGAAPFPGIHGQSPALEWLGQEAELVGSGQVGPGRWLQSITPVDGLVNRLRQSSAFTLAVNFSSDRADQTGPARIVTISDGPYERNLTVAQEGPDLVLRLRTPFTGQNGTNPEFILPGVLAEAGAHRLVVAYTGRTLRLYWDRPERNFGFVLSRGLYLLWSLPELKTHQVRLNRFSLALSSILYPLVVFLPLVLLVLTDGGRRVYSRLFPTQPPAGTEWSEHDPNRHFTLI